MPKSVILNQHSLEGQTFGYSAADCGDLEATEYTLVTIVVDQSSSVFSFKDELEKMVQQVIESCQEDARAENLMVRLVSFSTQVSEIHGFKLLSECNKNDYIGCIHPNGMTALYDSAQNALLSSFDYAKSLSDNDFDVNAVNFIITDGGENSSSNIKKASDIANVIQNVRSEEALESIITILIGVGAENNQGVSNDLNEFNQDAKIDQYIETKDATAQTLAKLANFISKSISSQSGALSSGGASQLLQF